MTAVITHSVSAGGVVDPTADVDGAAWDAAHTISGQIGIANGGTSADLSATGGTSQVLKQASAGAAITVGTLAASEIASGAALTRVSDTNVTLTLGGAPTTALLTATSVTVGWSGTLALSRGGTAADLSATGGAAQYLKQVSSGAAITVGTIPAADIASGAALTKVDDTNVTLTLGGTPATAMLKASSLTLGWAGTLAIARGGTGAGTQQAAYDALAPTATRAGDITYWNGTHYVTLAGNNSGTKVLQEDASGVPSWASSAAAGVSSIAGNTGAFTLANGIDNSTNQIQLTAARRTLPTTQTLTSGTGATYTTPANCLWIEVFMVGGGGGASGVSSSANTFVAGSNGTASSFNSVAANPGSGATGTSVATLLSGAGGTGGTGTATRRSPGGPGQGGCSSTISIGGGGMGGGTYFSGGTVGPPLNSTNGVAGATNTGAGGGAASNNGGTNNQTGAGGGGGEFVYLIINSPSATYTYTVGPGGAGGSSTNTGGTGGSGVIFVIEHYGS